MNLTDIIMTNITIYIVISFISLALGYVINRNRVIGYAMAISILSFCVFVIVSGVYNAATNDVSIWKDTQPLLLIGSFIGGWTSYYWYDAGKWMANK